MSKRDIGTEILDGIQEIKEYRKSKIQLKVTELSEPSPPQVIRTKLKMSQSAFAALLGVSMRTLQDWEQGRRAVPTKNPVRGDLLDFSDCGRVAFPI